MTTIIEAVVSRWTDPNARPLLKSKLIDDDGRCCAQGDILRTFCAWTDKDLRSASQIDADRETAKALGISVTHSCLLRIVNDRQDGCPEDVLVHPERVLGDKTSYVLSFWRKLDVVTVDERPQQWTQWKSLYWPAYYAARIVAEAAVGTTVAGITRAALMAAKGTIASDGATREIQGFDLLPDLFFLPMFGITSLDQLT